MNSSRFAPFFLASSSGRPRLRIGIMLDGTSLPRMVAGVLEQIKASDFADLELVVFNAEASPAVGFRLPERLSRTILDREWRDGIAWSGYIRFDRRLSRLVDDPLEFIDGTRILDGIDAISVRPLTSRYVHRFTEGSLERIRESHLDVMLRFGFNILRGDILTVPRFGIWSFHHGDNDHYRGGPACFWEMVEGCPTTGVVLQRLTEELDAGLVLAKALFSTDSASLARNRQRAYYGAQHLAIQKLRELHQEGWGHVQQNALMPSEYMGKRRIYRRPTNREVLGGLVRT